MDHHGETWVRNNPKIHVVFVLDRHSLYCVAMLNLSNLSNLCNPMTPLRNNHDYDPKPGEYVTLGRFPEYFEGVSSKKRASNVDCSENSIKYTRSDYRFNF
ncbi:hypothetical protein WICANDRAFT_93718 [Wickerhamomyces anomalus NRRL Y-366-8]|uniref:Uncharacterized protein n=1 Tax=Wickerhamomyces anomalus (strain ATCC 58044 / CBS 1984 / NCYC 433 / NRRL Y-366-8) TaxID=683960 RepID=A0A1E3P1C7_WICAA|nr:uncharacterized protein WICANDRAFT_93718 [Wickerhamomyces anomalus NRRL Y-366-8]ODQ58994.1 hypothetical protein WICANDRAFT_93718 [Wickerhamomyces anomalus NRRL Y-366-8]